MMDRRMLLLAIAAQSATWKDEAFSPLNGSLAPAKAKGPFKLGKLIGRTLAVNQCLNYSGITSLITTNGISCTISNGTLHYQGTATASGYMGFISSSVVNQSTPSVQGHKYAFLMNLTGSIGTGFFSSVSLSSDAIKTDNIYTARSGTFYGQFKMTEGETYDFYITPKIHDLTIMFGPGREPTTIAEFKKVYSRENTAYTLGQLESSTVASIIANPYNLFDGELEQGAINGGSGNNESNSTVIRTKNYIKVTQGKQYTFEIPSSLFHGYCFVYAYDKNKNFIPNTNLTFYSLSSNTKTIPSGVSYIKFTLPLNSSVPSSNECCVHLTGTRMGYAPQKQTERLTLPNDLKLDSALDAKNIFEIIGAKYKYVNLGTLTFGMSSSGRFYVNAANNISEIKIPTSQDEVADIFCSKYTTINGYQASNFSTNKAMGINPNGYLYIRDDDYSTAADFKTAMNGIYLFYEAMQPNAGDTAVFTKNGGKVDLGTLNWLYNSSSGHERFIASNAIDNPNTQNNVVANIFCAKYISDTIDHTYTHPKDKIIATANKTIQVYDSSYTDATAFKTAMAGQYLNYELATPQTITIPLKKLKAVKVEEIAWSMESVSSGLNFYSTIIDDAIAQTNVYCSEYTSDYLSSAAKRNNIWISATKRINITADGYSTVADFVAAHRDDVIWFESVNDQAEWNAGICDAGGEFETGYVSPDAVLKIYEKK